jgi:hypothetical protein
MRPAYINNLWRTWRQEVNFRIGTGVGYFPVGYALRLTTTRMLIVSARLNATIQTRVRLEYDAALTEHLGLLRPGPEPLFQQKQYQAQLPALTPPTVLVGLNYHQQRPSALGPRPAPEPTGYRL